ncbi:hypothetical protein BH23ACT10_BH23ACT10_36520 [soil metagenome]
MWRALVLGLVTGMRSQLPAALLAWRQSQGVLPEEIAGPVRIFKRRGAVPLLTLAAVGELVGDKLPTAPSRMESGPFLGRLSLGATAGAGIASAFGRSRILGGLFGMAGAAAGSVLGLRYRESMAQGTDTPDGVWALLEDIVAVALGLAATRGPTA